MAPIVTSLASIVKQFGIGAVVAAGPSAFTATGGVISDYTVSGTNYRAHIFTSSGTFTVSSGSANIEYLVVGGGGGGGSQVGGGGGAGGLRTNLSGHPLAGPTFSVSSSPGSYTVTVGSGGVKAISPIGQASTNGTESVFGPPSPYYGNAPSPLFIVAFGGGGGGSLESPARTAGNSGGSGGGSSQYYTPQAGGFGYNPATPGPVLNQAPIPGGGPIAPAPYAFTQGNPGGPASGNGGGDGGPGEWAAGGGGAGAAGGASSGTLGGPGGAGVQVVIAGPPTSTGVGALNPGPGEYQWFAGGGGGGSNSGGIAPGGAGGGGAGGSNSPSVAAVDGALSTGGGGGGSRDNPAPQNYEGANGGSGIVVIRYTLPTSSGTAKATGGAISYYGGKTIHTFTGSGDFNNTSGSPITAEVFMVAGGGGGGQNIGGGGGAGGVLYSPAFTISTGPNSIVVGAGGATKLGYNVPNNRGSTGVDTTAFGKTASGGGGGGEWTGTAYSGGPGGSGGGGSNSPPGSTPGGPASQTPAPGTPTAFTGYGNAGGPGAGAPEVRAGGGGGAGGGGSSAATGHGGAGIQAPVTFQDPKSTVGAPGPNSQGYWFAGGGGGGSHTNNPAGSGGGPGGPYAGGGNGGVGPTSSIAPSGLQSTGGGGGGAGSFSTGNGSGAGGSGIVLIAYPT